MADDTEVTVHGLPELDSRLGRAAAALRRDFDVVIDEAAVTVAGRAREIAESKGLRESGDMIDSITPVPLNDMAAVVVPARHRGYPYPRRLEYEGRGRKGKSGPRAFLRPALQEKTGEIESRMKDVLDSITEGIAP